jgi:hypothetical protein
MGGIVDDQFVMAVPPRIAAACGFRATPAPAMRDGVCRAQGHVTNGLTHVTRIFQKRAFTKTTHEGPGERPPRAFLSAHAIRNPPDESRKYREKQGKTGKNREKQEERPLTNQRM